MKKRAVFLIPRRVLTALAVVLLASGCAQVPNIAPQAPNVVSLTPQDWYFFHGDNMPLHPLPDATGAWSFSFPHPDGHVNYLQTQFNATEVLHNVTIVFRIESDAPQYKVLDPTDHPPATVHLFFEQKNDDLRNLNGRWWATWSQYNLGAPDNTTIRFVIPLTPDQWSNVHGQRNPASFYAALANVGWIGMTFGGQSFFGHGVALSGGTAKYVLVDFSVN